MREQANSKAKGNDFVTSARIRRAKGAAERQVMLGIQGTSERKIGKLVQKSLGIAVTGKTETAKQKTRAQIFRLAAKDTMSIMGINEPLVRKQVHQATQMAQRKELSIQEFPDFLKRILGRAKMMRYLLLLGEKRIEYSTKFSDVTRIKIKKVARKYMGDLK